VVRSRSIVGITLVVSAAVLLAAGSVAYRSMATLSATSSALVLSRDRVLALEQVLAVLRDAETGQRGFLLTRQSEYLQPYQESLDRLERRLARVSELYAGDERAESTLRGLRTLVDDKLAELARTIELERSGARDGALSVVLSAEGKNSMDAIRSMFEAMQQAEELESERRLAAEQAARRATGRSILALTGLALLMSGVLLYVTRRSGARIRESEQHLATTLRSIGDAVITTDEAGRITLMNPIAEALTGWRSYAALGKPLSEVFRIINEHTRDTVESPVDKVLREGKIVGLANHTLLIRRDGAETPIEDSAAPIAANDGNDIHGVVLVFRDATGAREAERALLEADRRKDEFLAVLAHELRNPLAPIRQAAVIARAPNASDAQVRWSHEVIDRQVGHMARLLDDLLDVSRITRGTLEIRKAHVELAAVIESAIEMADPLIEARRHSLDIDLPAEPLILNADPLRIAQVVGNLLTNAAKYTRPGGKLRLEARADGDEVVIKVADNGVGLAKESLARLFEMFVQVGQPLDRTEGGLGIGLALAKGLVELHGGSITAESAGLNSGSVFTVRLPLVGSGALPRQPDAERPPPDDRGEGLRILVADDNRDAAESLATLLEMYGHRVETVHDGADALEKLAGWRPELALIDVGMPKLNGYEVAERARAQPWGRTVTLVAVTGWGQESDRERALAAGFDEHWVKPVEIELVTVLCERLLAAKQVPGGERT
jgi:PAS domain S-box-containing protein